MTAYTGYTETDEQVKARWALQQKRAAAIAAAKQNEQAAGETRQPASQEG